MINISDIKRIDTNIHPKFKDKTKSDYALDFISWYCGIDGSHHKDWVLDQVARILHGVEVEVYEYRWPDVLEYRFKTSSNLTDEYIKFVETIKSYDEVTKEYRYEYSTGITP